MTTPGMRLTRLGKNLLAQAIAESAEIHFTRVGIGSGDFDYETERVHDLTELKNFEMWLPLTGSKVIGDGTAQITAYLSNAEVVKSFRCTEHGLFALDTAGNEILYAYRHVGEEFDTIPANTGTAHKNIFLNYIVEIDDAENITATLDLSIAYINTEDFKAHVESEHPHPNIPNKYDDVANTTEIWATDFDNHLHKLSTKNLRDVLKINELENKVANSISDEEKIFKAQNELGLNANLLMIEDFADDVVTDYFASAVNSVAENGNLIGIDSPEKLKTGGEYILSDGVSAETVKILAVTKNLSGYHAKLENPVANHYTSNVKLYRTTPESCQKLEVNYTPKEKFEGVAANIPQIMELDNYFTIEGDGYFDGESFTLG